MGSKFDFCGWATKNDLRCSDGRTIRKDAFKDNDGQTVPLVWQHRCMPTARLMTLLGGSMPRLLFSMAM